MLGHSRVLRLTMHLRTSHLLCLSFWDISQIKTITQVVTPGEYDEAVASDPFCSVFAFTGDTRSGRQLLEDANAEMCCPLQEMAAAPAGQEKLDWLSKVAEKLADPSGSRA